MIRPWYRSRLFWLGIPGLLFLLWLWLAKARADLFFGHTGITGVPYATTRGIGSCYGSIYYSRSRSRYGVSGPDQIGFHASEMEFESDEPTIYFPLRPFGIVQQKDDFHEYREIWVGWWVVVVAYTIAWLGGLVGWQRRKARLSRRATIRAMTHPE